MNSASTAIIVGASSGIGAALARRLAQQHRPVALLARRQEELQRLAGEINRLAGRDTAQAYVHDTRDHGEVERLWQRIETELGPVGSLFYAAGVMPPVGRTEFNTSKDELMLRVNTLGCMAWVNTAATHFLPRGAGEIVGISSVAQDRGRIGRPAYNASKSGMDTFLEAVRNRLWRRGITVTTIRPGFVDTPMIAEVEKKFWVISADRAAELTLQAVARRKSIAYVPARWRLLMGVIRNIPSPIFRKLDL